MIDETMMLIDSLGLVVHEDVINLDHYYKTTIRARWLHSL